MELRIPSFLRGLLGQGYDPCRRPASAPADDAACAASRSRSCFQNEIRYRVAGETEPFLGSMIPICRVQGGLQAHGVHPVGHPAEHQIGQYADPQPVFHQGHDGVIILYPVLDVGQKAVVRHPVLHGLIVLRLQKDEPLLPQLIQRQGGTLGQRMPLRQDHGKGVLHQVDVLEVGGLRIGHKAQIDLVVSRPIRDLRAVAQLELVPDIRADRVERLQALRQPVAGEAGEGADADHARLHVLELIELFLKPLLAAHQLLQNGQQLFAFPGGGKAGFSPVKQGQAALLLRGFKDLADPGRRVPEVLRRPGQVLQLGDFDDDLTSSDIHKYFSHPS